MRVLLLDGFVIRESTHPTLAVRRKPRDQSQGVHKLVIENSILDMENADCYTPLLSFNPVPLRIVVRRCNKFWAVDYTRNVESKTSV
jgi:hypothetical protein